MTGRRLRYTVYLPDPQTGETRAFGPGMDIPADVAELITNPTAWADEQLAEAGIPVDPSAPAAPGEQDTGEDGPPPRSGAGSGRDAWAAYAAANDFEVAADAGRDDIIEQLAEAGIPVDPAE
jgi:hypothetical protein